MPWQGTKTWIAGPWTFSDANRYVRDNIESMRRRGMSAGHFNEATQTINDYNSPRSFPHYAVLPEVLDEDCTLTLICSGQMSSPAGGATGMYAVNFDQYGRQKGAWPGGALSFVGWTINQWEMFFTDSWVVPAGENPGWNITLQCGQAAGSCHWLGSVIYIVTPVT